MVEKRGCVHVDLVGGRKGECELLGGWECVARCVLVR